MQLRLEEPIAVWEEEINLSSGSISLVITVGGADANPEKHKRNCDDVLADLDTCCHDIEISFI